ncbi:MAG: hypothetical protein QW416_02155 [Candidatus Nitrosocaldaceae archaeon]
MHKVVALLSGGLDSTLSVKIMKDQGFDVKALAIKTPFCDFDCGHGCGFKVMEVADRLGVDLKTVYIGDEYIEMLKNPKHGYGSGMNPCIDCRIMMYKEAKKYMEEIGAEFIITGEVLGQRPMSQNKRALKIIELEGDLEGKVLRPLSGKNLEPIEAEKKGIIDRNKLLSIRGRSRKTQFRLAKELGIVEYPNAAGGCLLTDPQFSKRVKDLLKYVNKPTLNDIELLKIGRHFRLDNSKLIVGRNKEENEKIKALALDDDILLETRDYKGPVGLLRKDPNDIMQASMIVLRYSDAPKNKESTIISNIGNNINVIPIDDKILDKYRI